MSHDLAVSTAEPSTNRGSGRRRLTIASSVAGAFAALALVLFGGVGAANATSIVSLNPLPASTNGQSVTVSGTGVAGNWVAVTECNSTVGGLNGTACNHAAPTSTSFTLVQVQSNGSWSTAITVRSSFANWNYQTNSAGTGTTNCKAAGTQCQIQVSEYTSNPPAAAPIGTAAANISF